MFPDVGVNIPPNILSSVVFPAPLGPSIPTISPFSALKLTLFTAKILLF